MIFIKFSILSEFMRLILFRDGKVLFNKRMYIMMELLIWIYFDKLVIIII